MVSLKSKRILDLGASKYGYAMAESLKIGVSEYVGIDIDLDDEIFVSHKRASGHLLRMNAEKLKLKDNYFDVIVTISTFEHFSNLKAVLEEMYRVLKNKGSALITFSPVWSSAKGYHLHQYPHLAKHIPPWSHLLLDHHQMADLFKRSPLPSDSELKPQEIIKWIYYSQDINRQDICQVRAAISNSKFKIDWEIPLYDNIHPHRHHIAKYLSTILPYTKEELLIDGLTIKLTK